MFGEVLATGELCDTVKINDAMVAAYALQRGHEAEALRLEGEIGRRMADEKSRLLKLLAGRQRDAVCRAGLLLYGPSGTQIPGLIEPK